jgi:hypothetical protein
MKNDLVFFGLLGLLILVVVMFAGFDSGEDWVPQVDEVECVPLSSEEIELIREELRKFYKDRKYGG